MNAIVYPKTLIQAVRYFSDPKVTHEFFTNLRWGSGVACPHCGSTRVHFLPNQLHWKCGERHRKRQFSVRTGTVIEKTRLGLDKWAVAVWLDVNAKNPISSYQLHRAIGITQKSAWFMLHRIGLAVQAGSICRPPMEDRTDGEFRWWNAPEHRQQALLQVDNPGAAFWKLKHFMRQILAVPKKKIDRKLARERAKKRKK